MKRIRIRSDHDHYYSGDLHLLHDEDEYHLPLTLTFSAYGGGSSSIGISLGEAHRLRRAIEAAITAEKEKGWSDFEEDQVELFSWEALS